MARRVRPARAATVKSDAKSSAAGEHITALLVRSEGLIQVALLIASTKVFSGLARMSFSIYYPLPAPRYFPFVE